MSRQELIQAAKASTEAYNEKDWKAARTTLAPGFVYDEVATGRTIEGIDEVLEAWKGWAKAFPDSRATFEEPLVDGNVVVLPIRWRGTHSGPLTLPTGEILPTQQKIDFRACQVFDMENGRAVHMRHYFDMMTMLSQLGVAPEPKVKSEARAR